jgi:hypothetical protein
MLQHVRYTSFNSLHLSIWGYLAELPHHHCEVMTTVRLSLCVTYVDGDIKNSVKDPSYGFYEVYI